MRSKVSSGSFLRSKSNPNIVFSQSTVAVTFRKWWTFIWRWHYFCRQTRKKYTPFISPELCACVGSLVGSPLYLEGIKAIENTKKKSWNKLESRPFDWQERCFFLRRLCGNRGIRLASGVKREFAWKNITHEQKSTTGFIVLWQKQRKRFLLLILEYTMHVIRVHFSGENAFVLN